MGSMTLELALTVWRQKKKGKTGDRDKHKYVKV